MIESTANKQVKNLIQLMKKSRTRREEGLFVVEGVRMFREVPTERLVRTYVSEGFLEKEENRAVLKDIPYEVMTDKVFTTVSDTQTPQGVVFLCKGKSLDPPEELEGDRFLVLDGVQDPGNVGAIWRSADAFGADGLILCGPCADPWSPKTVRATMGAVFRLPVWETTLEELAACLERKGIPLYSTALREDTVDVRQIDLSRAAVIVGSEGRGVSPLALELCEMTIKIPMRAGC